MHNLMFIRVAIVMVMCWIPGQALTQIDFVSGDFSAVKEQSLIKNRLIFVNAYADWSGPCRLMESNVFSDPEVAAFFNDNFICWKLDTDDPVAMVDFEALNIQSIPDFLFIDGKGKLIYRGGGYLDKADLLALAKGALGLEGGGVAAETVRGDLQMLRDEILDLHKAGRPVKDPGMRYIGQLQEGELLAFENWKIVHLALDDYSSRAFLYILDNIGTFQQKFGDEQVADVLLRTYSRAYLQSIEDEDESLLRLCQTITIKLMGGEADALELNLRDAITFYLETGMNEKMATASLQYMRTFDPKDPSDLNQMAWNFFLYVENPEHLAVAEGWAAQSVKKDRQFYNLDTWASLLFKLGRKEEARVKAEEALALAKEAGQDPSPIQQLLDKINAAQ